jgi:hypothetical protein
VRPLRCRPLSLALRLLVSSALMLGLAQVFALDAVRFLVPLVRFEVQALGTDYRVLGIYVENEPSGATLRLQADLAHPLQVHGVSILPHGSWPRPAGWYQVNLNARSVLRAVLLVLIIVLAWPSAGMLETACRWGVTLPLVAILIMVDAPLDLLGNLQQGVMRPWDPDGMRALFLWGRFLEAGGNLALALAFALIAIVTARRAAGARAGGSSKSLVGPSANVTNPSGGAVILNQGR